MGDGSGDGNNGEGSGNSGISDGSISDSSIGGTSPSANENDNGGTSVGLADFSAAVSAAVAGLGGFSFDLSPAFGAANLSSVTTAPISFDGTVSGQAFTGPTGALATIGLENAAVAPAKGLSLFDTLWEFGKGVLQGIVGVAAVATGTPAGLYGGGKALGASFDTFSGLSGSISGSPVSSVAGDSGANVSFGDGASVDFLSATSAPASRVAGGGIGGAQVLGFNGEPVATTSGAPASNGVLSGLSSLLAGLSRPNTAQYAANPSPAPNPALLLAVGAFFLLS